MEYKISTIAGGGREIFGGYGGFALTSYLNDPVAIAINHKSGDIYISDVSSQRISLVSSLDGTISTIAGNGTRGFSGDGGLAINSQLSKPHGIAIDQKSGDIYIADCENERIRKVSSLDGTISTIAGNGTRGFSGDGGLAINSQFFGPAAIAIDQKSGDIYIAEYGSNRIRKIWSQDGTISTIAGDGIQGFDGDGGLATSSRLNNPQGIAIHPNSGDIYIADRSNHRIRKVSSLDGTISTVAGDGIQGFDGDGGLATSSRLRDPKGIAIHPNGDIYIADYGNNRIRKVSSLSGIISTVAGDGTRGFSGDGGLATSSHLNNPQGIAIHPNSGDIYIADRSNHRIRKINNSFKLKKQNRDIIKGTNITYCKYVLDIYSPQLLKLVTNEQIIKRLNDTQQTIIQHLIDSLIYDENDSTWFENYDLVDILFILGMVKGGVDDLLQPLKRKLIDVFMNSFNENTCPEILEKVIVLKELFPKVGNSLLDQMINFAYEKAAEMVKKSDTAVDIPIINKLLETIASKISKREASIITVKEDDLPQTKEKVENLFNHEISSDITMKIGNNEYLCHKTILSSRSTYYESLFESGSEYEDLKENIVTVNTTDFDEISQEIILKYCYGIFDTKLIDPLIIIPLFQCAHCHDMKELVNYCVANIEITLDNYCDIIPLVKTYETLLEKLIQFVIYNGKQLLGQKENLEKIPSWVKDEIFLRQYHQ